MREWGERVGKWWGRGGGRGGEKERNIPFFIIHTLEKLAVRMEQELRRLQRRRLFTSDESGTSAPSSPGTSCGTGTGQTSNKEQPLFTLKQVRVQSVLVLRG